MRTEDAVASEPVRVTGLTKRQEAAFLRARGASQEEAAGQVGVSSRTLRRWERGGDRGFWDAFEEARRELMKLGFGRAWATLEAKLNSKNEAVAVASASKIVDAIGKLDPQRHEISGPGGGPIETYRVAYPEETDKNG